MNFSISLHSANDNWDFPAGFKLSLNEHSKEWKVPDWLIPMYNDGKQNHPREFSLNKFDESLSFYYGVQPNYGKSQYIHWEIPWKTWNFDRWTVYNPDHTFFAHIEIGASSRKKWSFEESERIRAEVPKAQISFNDFDGEEIIATCFIEEREWFKGTKSFSWLKYIFKSMIKRQIDITFDKETGAQKGSYKGGTVGCSEDIGINETILEAFTRRAIRYRFTNLKELSCQK